ncbi:MAG: hypothetical protein C6I00_06340 [Nitratiruptor sp.]|nr:hypothetical protein [Nitratiruptor sp.]NPA83063.1 DUF3157 family protein [Campylobacterota bacterium]
MKPSLLLAALSAFLIADSYVTLDNGKTIHLKDDGTWEEVKVIKKGEREIVLRPDGTWEEIRPESVEGANIITNKVDQRFKDSPLGRALLGHWISEDGREELIFTPNHAILKLRSRNGLKSYAGKWRIEELDEEHKRIKVNIGEGARLGFVTFGGIMRTLRFSDDLHTLYDESDRLSSMRVYRLHKVK